MSRRYRRSRALALPLAGVALHSASAFASGFNIDEQDARATGRAGAVVASTNAPSSIYYNSAGIALSQGLGIDVGGSYVRPTAEFTSAASGETTEAGRDSFVLPQAFVSWRASELVALGVGLHSSYGLALKWPETSPGRAQVREAELRTLFITPTLALNLSRYLKGLAVGAGIDLVPASVRLSRDVLFGTDTGTVTLGGDAFGAGARVGISYRPEAAPALAFGLVYRSPVVLDFSGDADFDAPPEYRPSLPPDGDVKTELTLPQAVQLGVQVSPVRELQIELDGSWRGWTSYDQLDITLPDGTVESSPRDWKNSFCVRLGAEYTFVDRWSVRVGAIWDQAPVPANRLDFQLPDANRFDLSGGLGARLSEVFALDASVLYVLPQQRSTSMQDPLEPPVKGRFDIDALVVGLTLRVQLETAVAPPLEVNASPCERPGAHLHACR
jgi:long-chain fatty acid transport protein